MPLVSDVAAIFWSSIAVLIPNGQFLDCATVAFSDRYVAGVYPLKWRSAKWRGTNTFLNSSLNNNNSQYKKRRRCLYIRLPKNYIQQLHQQISCDPFNMQQLSFMLRYFLHTVSVHMRHIHTPSTRGNKTKLWKMKTASQTIFYHWHAGFGQLSTWCQVVTIGSSKWNFTNKFNVGPTTSQYQI
jgi:hypothetical protein